MSDSFDKLRSLRNVLESRIIGQREALNDITALLSRALCGCRYPGRPIASMLFLGSTGVGKTETARIFTEHLFGEESKLVRLDMSEYMTLHSIDILRGSHQSEDCSATTTITHQDAERCFLMRSKKLTRSSWIYFCRS
jgi:ATP-dependent Clp protease ATP-binding subunit ClpA